MRSVVAANGSYQWECLFPLKDIKNPEETGIPAFETMAV